MRSLKFIHILACNELKFSKQIVSFTNDDSVNLEKSIHFFVTPFCEVYQEIECFPNTELYKESYKYISEVVKHYIAKCDYIILHSIHCSLDIITIPKKHLKKIFWRSWGGNPLGINTEEKFWLLKMPLRCILKSSLKKSVLKLAGIGVANTVDILEIQKKLKDEVSFFIMPYPNPDNTSSLFETYKSYAQNRESSDYFNIMIGHSGFREDNHKEIINMLKRFQNEKIRLFLPLSYGNKKYIDELRQYVSENWPIDKVTIVDEFLNYQDYVRLLAQMDIAFFDATYSYALGNIAILLLLNKKIVLNRDGVIQKAFNYEGIPCEYSDNIPKLNFEEFTAPIIYNSDSWKKLSVHTYEQHTESWNEIIRYCKKLKMNEESYE